MTLNKVEEVHSLQLRTNSGEGLDWEASVGSPSTQGHLEGQHSPHYKKSCGAKGRRSQLEKKPAKSGTRRNQKEREAH